MQQRAKAELVILIPIVKRIETEKQKVVFHDLLFSLLHSIIFLSSIFLKLAPKLVV